jgi:hypothetical protein
VANVSHDPSPVQFDEVSPFVGDDDAWWAEDLSCPWSETERIGAFLDALPDPTFGEWLEGEAERYDAFGTCGGRVVAASLRELASAAVALHATSAEDFEARDLLMTRDRAWL